MARTTFTQRNIVLLATALIFVLVSASVTSAEPVIISEEVAETSTPYVLLDKRVVSVNTEGAFRFGVEVFIDRPTTYLESRVQIHRPTGQLVYQKTHVRNDVETGTVEFSYSRDLDDLDLQAGAYPIEVRVRSDSGEVREWVIEDDLLIYDSTRDPLSLVVMTCLNSTPGRDSEGLFVIDPELSSRARSEAEILSQAVIDQSDLHISLAIPPLVLEDWLRISQGYEYVSPEGVKTVSADSKTAGEYLDTLGLIKSALATERLELIDVPYASPDISGLIEMQRIDDLLPHYERGLSTYLATLEISPSNTTYLAEGYLPSSAVPVIASRGIDRVVAELDTNDYPPGAYKTESDPITVLAIDAETSETFASKEATSFASSIFTRYADPDFSGPAIVMVDLGPGSTSEMSEIAEVLDELSGEPWVDFISTEEVGEDVLDTLDLSDAAASYSDAPDDYWPKVEESRILAEALLAATDLNDPTAQATSDASLVAESRSWAGPDGKWTLADRGRSFADAATRSSEEVFGKLSFAVNDVTLSAAGGEVPVSIVNGTNRTLSVIFRTFADGLTITDQGSQPITLGPAENYFTVPVDLKSSLAGKLRVEIWSADLLIDEAEMNVTASYLDRLAIVGGVAIILAAMLLFIRRRVKTAPDTIDGKSARDPDSGRIS